MFSKKKNSSKLDAEQRELYENARRRTLQKKRLLQHFVVFLVGAVIIIVLNVVIGFREDFMPWGYNWFVWAILIWTFFFLIHAVNVMLIHNFMGKEWEQRQMERLVKKQRERIKELERKVEREHPVPNTKQPTPAPAPKIENTTPKRDKDTPGNNIKF